MRKMKTRRTEMEILGLRGWVYIIELIDKFVEYWNRKPHQKDFDGMGIMVN